MKILAGDMGGTKTLLALVERSEEGNLRIVEQKRFESRAEDDPGAMARRFLDDLGVTVERACFGVAAPVTGGAVDGPNLPWTIREETLAARSAIPHVRVINDFEAIGLGLGHLGPDDLATLQEGKPEPGGPVALLGAGTGLGEAFLLRHGGETRVWPTEGGHADFAPRNALEFGLLLYFRERLKGRVSVERILSGGGLAAIYDYLVERNVVDEDRGVRDEMRAEDPAAVVTRRALAGDSEGCVRALDLFLAIYGAEAGNLALRILATGGVTIGGGIAPRIVEKMKGPVFLGPFRDKGRFAWFTERVPVRVVLNEKAALFGAAVTAMGN